MKTTFDNDFLSKFSNNTDRVILITGFSLDDSDNKSTNIYSIINNNLLDIYLNLTDLEGYVYDEDTLVEDKKSVKKIKIYYKIEGEKCEDKLMFTIDNNNEKFTLDSRNNLFHIPLWEGGNKVKIKSLSELDNVRYLESAGTDKIMNIFYLDSIGDRDKYYSVSKESYLKYSTINELIPSSNFGWLNKDGKFNSDNYTFRIYKESTFNAGVSDMLTLGGILTKLQLFRDWNTIEKYKNVKVRGTVEYTEYQVTEGIITQQTTGIADVTGIDGLEIVCDESEDFSYYIDNSLSNISYDKMKNPEDLNLMPYGIFHLELSYKDLTGKIIKIKSNKFKLVQSGDTSIFNVHHSTAFKEEETYLYLTEDREGFSKTFYATLLTDSSISTLSNNIYFLFEGDNLVNGRIIPGKYREYMESLFDIKYKVSRLLDETGAPVKDTLRIDITLVTKESNNTSYWLPRLEDVSFLIRTTLVIIANSDQYEENFYIVQKAKTLGLEVHDNDGDARTEITVPSTTNTKELALSFKYGVDLSDIDTDNLYWRLIEIKVPILIEDEVNGVYINTGEYTTTNFPSVDNLISVDDRGLENKINDSIPDINSIKTWDNFIKFNITVEENLVTGPREIGILKFVSVSKDSYPLGNEYIRTDSWRFFASSSSVDVVINQEEQDPFIKVYRDIDRTQEITEYEVGDINSYPLYINSNFSKVTVKWESNQNHILENWGDDSYKPYDREENPHMNGITLTPASWTSDQRKKIMDNIIDFYGDLTNTRSSDLSEYTATINSSNHTIYFNVNYNIDKKVDDINYDNKLYKYITYADGQSAGNIVFYKGTKVVKKLPIKFNDVISPDPSIKGIHDNPRFIDFEKIHKDYKRLNLIRLNSEGIIQVNCNRSLNLNIVKDDLGNKIELNTEKTKSVINNSSKEYLFIKPTFGIETGENNPKYLCHEVYIKFTRKIDFTSKFPIDFRNFYTRFLFSINPYNNNIDKHRFICPVIDEDDDKYLSSFYSTCKYPNSGWNSLIYNDIRVNNHYVTNANELTNNFKFGYNKVVDFKYNSEKSRIGGKDRYPSYALNLGIAQTTVPLDVTTVVKVGNDYVDKYPLFQGDIRFGKDYISGDDSGITIDDGHTQPDGDKVHNFNPGHLSGNWSDTTSSWIILNNNSPENIDDVDSGWRLDKEDNLLSMYNRFWFAKNNIGGYDKRQFYLKYELGNIKRDQNYLRFPLRRYNELVDRYFYLENSNLYLEFNNKINAIKEPFCYGRLLSFEFFGDKLAKGISGNLHFFQHRFLYCDKLTIKSSIINLGIFTNTSSIPVGDEFKSITEISNDDYNCLMAYLYEQFHSLHVRFSTVSNVDYTASTSEVLVSLDTKNVTPSKVVTFSPIGDNPEVSNDLKVVFNGTAEYPLYGVLEHFEDLSFLCKKQDGDNTKFEIGFHDCFSSRVGTTLIGDNIDSLKPKEVSVGYKDSRGVHDGFKIIQKGFLYSVYCDGKYFAGKNTDTVSVEKVVSYDTTEVTLDLYGYKIIGNTSVDISVNRNLIIPISDGFAPNTNTVEIINNGNKTYTFKLPERNSTNGSLTYQFVVRLTPNQQLSEEDLANDGRKYEVIDNTTILVNITQEAFVESFEILNKDDSTWNFKLNGSSVDFTNDVFSIRSNNPNLAESSVFTIEDSNNDGLILNWSVSKDSTNTDEDNNVYVYLVSMRNNTGYNRDKNLEGQISFKVSGNTLKTINYKQGYLCIKALDADTETKTEIGTDENNRPGPTPYYLYYKYNEVISANVWSEEGDYFDSVSLTDDEYEYITTEVSGVTDGRTVTVETKWYDRYNGKSYSEKPVLVDTPTTDEYEGEILYTVTTMIPGNIIPNLYVDDNEKLSVTKYYKITK